MRVRTARNERTAAVTVEREKLFGRRSPVSFSQTGGVKLERNTGFGHDVKQLPVFSVKMRKIKIAPVAVNIAQRIRYVGERIRAGESGSLRKLDDITPIE